MARSHRLATAVLGVDRSFVHLVTGSEMPSMTDKREWVPIEIPKVEAVYFVFRGFSGPGLGPYLGFHQAAMAATAFAVEDGRPAQIIAVAAHHQAWANTAGLLET